MTTQLQAKYSLPDILMDEIYWHIHQLYLADVNPEYHQTWFPYYIDGEFVAMVCKDDFDINYRDIRMAEKGIYNLKDPSKHVAKISSIHWYSSGTMRQDGYQSR